MWACTCVYKTWQHKMTACLGKEYGQWLWKVESWELITISNNWSYANKGWADLSGTELFDPVTMQGELRSTSVLDVMEEFPALDTVVGWGLRKWGGGEYWTTSPIIPPLTPYAVNSSFSLLCFLYNLEAHWFTTDLPHKMLEWVMVVTWIRLSVGIQ